MLPLARGRSPKQRTRPAQARGQGFCRATASASDDASNGPRKAPARSGGEGERTGEKSERTGIIQIINNTVDKLVKLTLHNATIDQPNAATTLARDMAAIDIQAAAMCRSQ